MRLIDADVFKTEYENLITWVSHRAEKARLREFIKDIQDQPTVKAIPIEWIKKWCNEHNRKSLEERLLKRYGVITMLEDWEEENEKDI